MDKTKKLKKLVNYSENKSLATFEELNEILDNLEVLAATFVGFDPEKGVFQGPQGEKGEKGDTTTGPQGPMGPKPVAGVDYPIPKDGKDGKDGRDGMDGQDSEVPGPEGKPGKDGSPDTAEQVRDKLQSLAKEGRLDISAIKGIELLVDRATMDRAISILDQRTQTIINRFSFKNFIEGVNTSKLTVSVTAPTDPALNDFWCDVS